MVSRLPVPSLGNFPRPTDCDKNQPGLSVKRSRAPSYEKFGPKAERHAPQSPKLPGGWNRPVAGCRLRTMVCGFVQRPSVGVAMSFGLFAKLAPRGFAGSRVTGHPRPFASPASPPSKSRPPLPVAAKAGPSLPPANRRSAAALASLSPAADPQRELGLTPNDDVQ